MKKVVSLILIMLLIVFTFSLIGCTNDKDNRENEIEGFEWTNQGTDDYMTTYLVLIGNNDYYDGEEYEEIEAGTYLFKQTNNRENAGIDGERVYNIYILDYYIDLEHFEEVKGLYNVGSVGGYNGQEMEIELKDGQFLYIQNVAGGSIGHLKVTKVK